MNGSERDGASSVEHGLGARSAERYPAAAQSPFSRQPIRQPVTPVREFGNGAPERIPSAGAAPTDHREPADSLSPGLEVRPRDPTAPLRATARLADEGLPRDLRSSDGVARGDADPLRSREGGAIDRALRDRVRTDAAAFLAAFDAALADDTAESRAGLREATDRLLRAGARTRIELERLEARLPLPPRDKPAAAMPAWRQR